MKIIIYAIGKTFEQHKQHLDWNQIVALSDKKAHSITEIEGRRVIAPNEIANYKYDIIAVFSDILFESIKRELIGEYDIPSDRIIPWREIVQGELKPIHTMIPIIALLCKEKNCKSILDVGMTVLPQRCLIKEELFGHEDMILEGVWREGATLNENLYDSVYTSSNECKKQYDAVLLWNVEDNLESMLDLIKNQTRYILMSTRYLIEGRIEKEVLKKTLRKFGKVTTVSGVEGIIWIVDTKFKTVKEDISIYVVSHRKYNCHTDKMYKMLCVGSFEKKGCLIEKKGNNISHLNKKINECTALYWIWKNTDSKYVGLNHYRRYFYNNGIRSMDNYLDREHAVAYLEEYDIILPTTNPLSGLSVYEQIEKSIDHELFQKGYRILRNRMEQKQPDYINAFDSVMNGHNAFLYNLFVTRREVLNQYCKWLFSFLTEAAEEINVEGYDEYSQRVIGFFAERMWTVWLRKNRIRIKELPCVLI